MLSKKLFLKKTHDFSAVKNPKLTVIFLHGIASDSGSTYTKALEYLEGTTSLKEVRFITFDLLGSGESYSGDELNYDFKDQLEALKNSIKKLKISTPIVLVGHSMGGLIATRYADTYKKSIKKLILVSTPTYTVDNLDSPMFKAEMEAFKKLVAAKNPKYVNDKAFHNEVKNIVLNKSNYNKLLNLKTPAVLIYSESDRTIMPQNIRKIIKLNPKYLSGVTTIGTHRVARDKYNKIKDVLEEMLNA
ncbi:MAG: alpha/beta fold hydrolase [Candidatus Saccharibacteria bacterium]|nr:alpha/beta fold hydrolase [Candidatus Saccharibacteria bacterium]